MAWWIWLIIGLVLGIIELLNMTFVLLWIAVSAILTSLITWVGVPLWAQMGCFIIFSIALLVVTRPLARKWRLSKTYESHSQTMVDKTAIVIQDSVPGAFATVRVDGETWSARSTEPLKAGDKVRITDASTPVLVVELERGISL